MNRTMAVYVVAQEIYRRAFYEYIPPKGRWRIRNVWLAYRDLHMTIEWQLREEIRLELE
jgi:hypothetical protein